MAGNLDSFDIATGGLAEARAQGGVRGEGIGKYLGLISSHRARELMPLGSAAEVRTPQRIILGHKIP
jgi:hypothetical protein